ncbi:MAG: hypothetical protein ACOC5T_05725 [Elusimicrobiota bacterium]
MVNLHLYPHRNSKKNMKKLFETISETDYEQSVYISRKIQEDLLEYYQTRGMDCSIIYNLFDELEYTIRVHTPGRNKTKKLFDILGRISNLSYSVTKPIEKIRLIREDLRYYYLNDILNNQDIILGCFDDLMQLQTEIKEIGGSVYNYYNEVLSNVSDCEAVLGKYKTRTPKDSLLKEIADNFAKLFKSMMRVISPPVVVETKDEELYKMAKSGISLKDLADGMGVDEVQLDERLRDIEAKYMSQSEEDA